MIETITRRGLGTLAGADEAEQCAVWRHLVTSQPRQPRLTCDLALRSRSCSTWRRRESSVGGGVTKEAREPQREPARPPPTKTPPRPAPPDSLAIATSPSRSATSRSSERIRASLVSSSAVRVAEVPASPAAGPLSPHGPPKLWSCSRRSRSATSRASCSHTPTPGQPQATAAHSNTRRHHYRRTLRGQHTARSHIARQRLIVTQISSDKAVTQNHGCGSDL